VRDLRASRASADDHPATSSPQVITCFFMISTAAVTEIPHRFDSISSSDLIGRRGVVLAAELSQGGFGRQQRLRVEGCAPVVWNTRPAGPRAGGGPTATRNMHAMRAWIVVCVRVNLSQCKHKRGSNEVPDIRGGRSVPYDALMMRRG
jgi:hypothetical protein